MLVIHFLFVAEHYSIVGIYQSIHSPTDGQLSCSQFGGFINKIVINIPIVSVCTQWDCWALR